jgi:hypothetical protein
MFGSLKFRKSIMKKVIFTADQVKLIINTLLEVPAKLSFEVLRMIEIETAKQASQNNESAD